jgi:surface antigen
MDDQRYLYISDGIQHEVRRYQIGDTNGSLVAGGNGRGAGLSQLDTPTYIFVDRKQTIYISDKHNCRVMEWKKGAKEGIVVAGGQGEGKQRNGHGLHGGGGHGKHGLQGLHILEIWRHAEQAELLAKTRGDEAIYRALVEADTTRLATLRAQQSAAIAAQSLGRNFSLTTEYPWTAVEPFPSRGVDPWGFYYRQCTSYAAWKRASIGRPLPAWGFLGPANAKQWPEWAGKFGMRVDTTPEVGAAAVYPVGEYGHVMIVEGIVSNGAQVLVSEFNADWGGHYSQSLWQVSSLIFIH